MTANEEHLSMFELDLYFATRAPDARIEQHVASCERCSGYLSELEQLQQAVPRAAAKRALPRQRPVRSRIFALSLAAIAALGTLTVLRVVPLDSGAPAVGVKGSPAVQLLVQRRSETRPWDGASPVRAGDALALRVVCEGFERVAVAVDTGGERWSRLSEGACPAAGAALPFTLLVDDEPGAEHLAVAFSKSALAERTLQQAIAERRRDAQVWVTRFELVKEPAR
ncbi:MAG TPA: hypothetical protein VFS67_36455 [Polyangiaceae bacterium]|jgi:hypothetical protein|nr:hypothetical protein [Polyangiaceae bacterium]